MKEIEIDDKQKYLDDNYPFQGVPKLTDKMKCIHCERTFEVSEYRVVKSKFMGQYNELICCPNKKCDGTVMDWQGIE
jgi:hypothetical protein